MNAFSVSYSRVNEREATAGGTTRYGMVDDNLTLRDAIDTVRRETCAASSTRGTWPDCSDERKTRFVTAEIEEWETGDSLALSIHYPDNATPASRARLSRLLRHVL